MADVVDDRGSRVYLADQLGLGIVWLIDLTNAVVAIGEQGVAQLVGPLVVGR